MIDEERLVVGLDVGTTYCAAVIFDNGKLRDVDFDYQRTVPSCFSIYNDDGSLEISTRYSTVPRNSEYITNVKRVIGRSDGRLAEDVKSWNLNFEVNEEGRAIFRTAGREVLPQEFLSLTIRYLIAEVEKVAKKKVTHIGIAVPANFGDDQRQAVLEGARIAGLRNVKFVNEPTAAALAYLTTDLKTLGERFLIVDMGGGTTDCSLVNVNPARTRFDVIAISGHNALGGEDFTNTLVEMVNRRLEDHNIDPYTVKNACEEAKRGMTPTSNDIRIHLPSSTLTIKKEKFKEAAHNRLDELEDVINCVFESLYRNEPRTNAFKQKVCRARDSVDGVITVGGGCRQPFVLDVCERIFGAEKVLQARDICTLVAQGAALAAHPEKPISVSDVLSKSLGINVQDPSSMETNKTEFLLFQNEHVPCSKSRIFEAVHEKETEIWVVSGEHESSSDNTSMHRFLIPAKRPQKVKVDLRVDEHGMYYVFYTIEGEKEEIETFRQESVMSEQTIADLQAESLRRFESKFMFEANVDVDGTNVTDATDGVNADVEAHVTDATDGVNVEANADDTDIANSANADVEANVINVADKNISSRKRKMPNGTKKIKRNKSNDGEVATDL